MNLLSMHDSAYYTVLYFGESISFRKRMNHKDPVRFLSWFPATHTFMLAKLSPVCSKGTNKAACLGLEAIMAILMSKKLPGMSHEEGRCFNDAHCGYRFWGKGQIGKESLMYVSFEKVDGDFLPIIVHPNFHHIQTTYGTNNDSFTSSMVEKNPFHLHKRVKKVFLKAFQSDKDENMRRCLISCFSTQRKGGGRTLHTSSERRSIC